MADDGIHELAIIGGGPAGYTAALYAARGALSPVVIEGYAAGGQLMITSDVDNFPGFQDGIMGPELMQQMRAQAERFGAVMRTEDVTEVRFSDDPMSTPHELQIGSDIVRTRTVVVATGATARQIGLDSEVRLQGRGVSYCAVCDAAFFREQEVVIVGGGDSAMEEATFLTKFADKVYVIHRKDSLRASKAMQDRAFADPKIEFLWNTEVQHIYGDELVTGIGVVDVVDGTETTIDLSGLFIAIGADPRTHLVHGQLDLNPDGTIAVDGRSSRTNIPGVFAAGDVIDPTYRQAVTAAGSGTVAALDAEHYLAALPKDVLARADAQPAAV